MNKFHIAFVFSVLLNLFLAGALIAGALSLRGGGRMINAGLLRVAGAELPSAERKPFRATLRAARRAMRPTILAGRTAKQQAAALLRQPVLDQVAILVALDRARTADLALRAAVERSAVDYAAKLPLADRVKLADAMQRRAEKIRPGAD